MWKWLERKMKNELTQVDTFEDKYSQLDHSCVLAGSLVCIGITELQTFHALLGVLPPPSSSIIYAIQKDLIEQLIGS